MPKKSASSSKKKEEGGEAAETPVKAQKKKTEPIYVPMDASEVVDIINKAKEDSAMEAPEKVNVPMGASGAVEDDGKEDAKEPETTASEESGDKMEEQMAVKEAPAAEAEKEAKVSPTKASPKMSPMKEEDEERAQKKAEEKGKKSKEKEQRRMEKETKKVEREMRTKEKKQREKEKKKQEAEMRRSFEALGAPEKKKKKNDKPQFVGGLPMAPIQHDPVVPNLYNYDPMAEVMQLGTGQLHSAYRKSRNTVAPPTEKKFYKLEHKPVEERLEGGDHGSTTPVYSGRDITPPHSPSQPTPTMVTTQLNYEERRSTLSGNAMTSGVLGGSASVHHATPRSSGFRPPSQRGSSFEQGSKSQENPYNKRPRSSYGHNYNNGPVTPSSSRSGYTLGGDRPPSTGGSEHRSGEFRPPSAGGSERRLTFGTPMSVKAFQDAPPVAQRPSLILSNANTVPQHRYPPGVISPNAPPPMGLDLPPFLQQERQAQEPERPGHMTAMEMVGRIRRNVRRMRELQANM